MKQSEPEGSVREAAVQAALSAVRVLVSPDQCRLLTRHANYVLDANTRMNLTRITEPEAVAALHIADSLAFTTYIHLDGRIIDIGAGAGYPGVPLAILGYDVWLCESVKKKAAFLRKCVSDLGIDSRVFDVRAEELAAAEPGSADVVVVRAVSSLSSLVELAAPLLANQGRLVALKGSPNDAERRQSQVAAEICGMKQISETGYLLPGGESRSVFVFQRCGRPRVRLPRSPGMAQRHPLGGIHA